MLVLVDGLRVDASEHASLMPELARLRAHGAWTTVASHTPSYSNPGWTVLLTGAWPDTNGGAAMNPPGTELPATVTGDDIVTGAHDAGLRTALVGSDWLSTLVPAGSVSEHAYVSMGDDVADTASSAQAVAMLAGAQRPDLMVLHLNNVDHTGHASGGEGPQYAAAAHLTDGHLKAVAAALALGLDGTPARDALVVVSDHGHVAGGGHGGGEAPVVHEPFVVVGAGAVAGRKSDGFQVDVAPTIARLLGTRPLTRAIPSGSASLVVPPADAESWRQAQANRDSAYADAYAAAVGDPARRLGQDRLRRGALALLLLIGAGVALRRWRPRARVLGASALAVAAYHLAWWGLGHTYSFSWVRSATHLVGSTGGLMAAALLLGWLALGPDRHRQTAAYVGAVAGLTALPVLGHWVVNGLSPWWQLPQPDWAWWGLMGGVQLAAVAVTGVVLLGFARLRARMPSANHP